MLHSYNPIVLSQPLQSKKLYRQGNLMFRVGAATMQGWRCTMEDTHCISLSLPNHQDTGFFAVYDGHGGLTTSSYLSQHFHVEIDNLVNVHNKQDIIKTAIEVDERVMSEKNTFRNGSTAVFAIVDYDPKHKGQYLLTLGNIGDSRAILIKGGKKGIALTKDHMPTQRRERSRIHRAGGVVKDGRVRGELAVSRSFGDAALKLPTNFPPDERMVTPIPDIRQMSISGEDLLLLTCDGIFEKDLVFNIDSASKFVVEDLRSTEGDLAMTLANLFEGCLERKSYDNMTAILVQFKEGMTYHQQGIEYLPGPFHEGATNVDFRKAYIQEAKGAGYTVKQARMKYDLMNENHKCEKKLKRVVQRRNSESEVLLSSKEKILSASGYESDTDDPVVEHRSNQNRRKSEHILTKEHIYSPPHHNTNHNNHHNTNHDHNNHNPHHSHNHNNHHNHSHDYHVTVEDKSQSVENLSHSSKSSLYRIKSTGQILNKEKNQLKPAAAGYDSSASQMAHSRRKSHSPNHKSETSSTINSRRAKKPPREHSPPEPPPSEEDQHFTSDNEISSISSYPHQVCSGGEDPHSSPENSPVLSRVVSDVALQRSAPKILHHLRGHRKKKGDLHRTPPDLDSTGGGAHHHLNTPEISSSNNSPSVIDNEGLFSDEDSKLVVEKKVAGSKNHKTRSRNKPGRSYVNEEISREDSEDGSCDHDITDARSELSDSQHVKKHHFHFPSFHSLWNHKRSISHKKEREGDHYSEHETTLECPTVEPRSSHHGTNPRRRGDSEHHPRRHHTTLSPRLFVSSVTIDESPAASAQPSPDHKE